MNKSYAIFCIGIQDGEYRLDLIKEWLFTIVQVWGPPTNVNYCGHIQFKECIKEWSQMFFGCKFVEPEESDVLVPTQKLSPKTMTILSPRDEEKKPSLSGRKKSSPRNFKRWIEETAQNFDHVVIFSSGEMGIMVYGHLPHKTLKALISI